jgi:hypothetical protein
MSRATADSSILASGINTARQHLDAKLPELLELIPSNVHRQPSHLFPSNQALNSIHLPI